MNRIFRKVWRPTLGQWVVASEFAKRPGGAGPVRMAAGDRTHVNAVAAAVLLALGACPDRALALDAVCRDPATGVAVGNASAAGDGLNNIANNTGINTGSIIGATAPSRQAMGAVAIGHSNVAIGQGSIALGYGSGARTAGSVAVGYDAEVGTTATRGVALGSGSNVTVANSVALGAGSTTTAGVGVSGTTINGTAYTLAATTMTHTTYGPDSRISHHGVVALFRTTLRGGPPAGLPK